MKCTEKERETCQVEKMGCEGCAYNELTEQEALKEIAKIEYRLAEFSRKFGFRYDIESSMANTLSNPDYNLVIIKVFKELN